MRVDVVGEREDRLLVGGVPLHRDLDGALVALPLEEDDLVADRVLVLVQVGDEVADAAVVLELRATALGPLVHERDPQSAGEEGRLTQTLLDDVELEVQRLEDVGVGEEGDRGPGLLRRGALRQRRLRRAALVVLRPDVTVAADLDVEALRQRVDHRHADAVQAARHLVPGAVAELPARVQHREHDLDGGALLLRHHGDRDAAPVVGDADGVVGVDHDLDGVAAAGHRLVHRVVHHLVDEMVQTPGAGRADVHAGALADRLEPLEHGDVLGVIAGLRRLRRALPGRGLLACQRSS